MTETRDFFLFLCPVKFLLNSMKFLCSKHVLIRVIVKDLEGQKGQMPPPCAVKMWSRVSAVDCLFGRCFEGNGSANHRNVLYVICECLYEFIFWGDNVWTGGALWIILSSRFGITVSRQVNIAMICYSLTCYLNQDNISRYEFTYPLK
jgi:hypothetical protein